MKKTTLLLLAFSTTIMLYSQHLIHNIEPRHQSYVDNIIATSDSTYAVLIDTDYIDFSYVAFFDKQHRLIKTTRKTNTLPNSDGYVLTKNGTNLFPVRLNHCDVSVKRYLLLRDTLFAETEDFDFRNTYIDNAFNVYRYQSVDNKIITSPFDNTSQTNSFDGVGYITNFIALRNDTVLIGNQQGTFYKATSKGILNPLPNLFPSLLTSNYSTYDFSEHYFCVKKNGDVYSKKTLKKIGNIGKMDDYWDIIKMIDNNIYVYRKSLDVWDIYKIDANDNVTKKGVISTDFKKYALSVKDFIHLNGKVLACAEAPDAINKNTNAAFGNHEFLLVLDSLTQSLNIPNEVALTLPIQTAPVYDNQCGGYKFKTLEIDIANNGSDTLRSIVLSGQPYGGTRIFCDPRSKDTWNIDSLDIAPKITQKIKLSDICIRGFERNSKDSIVSFCLLTALPNRSHDSDLTNNIACFSFKSYDKEIATNDVLLADYQATMRFYENEILVKIDVPFQHATFNLYDFSGRLIKQQYITNAVQDIDVNTFPAGMYIANLVIDRVWYLNKKIVLVR